MILSIEGEEKTGKSSIAYTAPLPIVAFNLDMSWSRAIYGKLHPEYFKDLKIKAEPYKKPTVTWTNGQATAKVEYEPYAGNDITIYEMPAPLQVDTNKVEGFMAQWAYFMTIYVAAVQDPLVKTVVIDTGTLLYKNKCDAYLEELNTREGKVRKQLLQVEYGRPNEGIRSVYSFAKSTGKNLITVHHLRQHYAQRLARDGSIETYADGTLETDGMRETDQHVDVVLRVEKRKDGSIVGSMPVCGLNLAVENTPIPGPTWDKLIDVIEMGWYGPKFDRRNGKDESGI